MAKYDETAARAVIDAVTDVVMGFADALAKQAAGKVGVCRADAYIIREAMREAASTGIYEAAMEAARVKAEQP